MALERKVAIVDKLDINLEWVKSNPDYSAQGISTVGMLVNMHTPPQMVVSFVDREIPDLVILAESYAGTEDVFADFRTKAQFIHCMPVGMGLPPIKRGEGVEALAKIRELHPQLPVYMLTSTPHHEDRAMKAGAKGYLDMIPSPEGMKALLDRHYPSAPPQHKTP